MANLFGDTSLQLIKTSRSYVPKQGWRTVQTYRGLTTDVEGQFGVLEDGGYEFEVTEVNGKFSTLEVKIDDPQDGRTPAELAEKLEIEWSVPPNSYTERDIFDWDKLGENNEGKPVWLKKAEVSGMLRQKLTDLQNATPVTTAKITALLAQFDEFPNYKRTLALAIKGQQSFQEPRFIIKRNITLPATYKGEYPAKNIGAQFTLIQLRDWEGLPEKIKVQVPSTGTWLKQSTGTTLAPGGKQVVQDEWWHAKEWDDLHYPAATAP